MNLQQGSGVETEPVPETPSENFRSTNWEPEELATKTWVSEQEGLKLLLSDL